MLNKEEQEGKLGNMKTFVTPASAQEDSITSARQVFSESESK
ncbi:hypothetical protein V6Z05_18205 [Leptospira venezuelensis]|nr:hypothetical protein [Leptospira venezuelensis]